MRRLALDVAGTLVEEKFHVVKEHQRRRVVTCVTCRCRACGERTTPDSLVAPFARSKVTGAWLAWLVHQKFSMLVPLDRIWRDLAGRGIAMPMSTRVRYFERAADLLDGVDGYHWKQLLAGAWMATDATADAEHRMNGVYREGVIEAGCNAHGRRKFRDAEATQPALALEGGKFIGVLYGEEEAAQKAGLEGEALLERRRERKGHDHEGSLANGYIAAESARCLSER